MEQLGKDNKENKKIKEIKEQETIIETTSTFPSEVDEPIISKGEISSTCLNQRVCKMDHLNYMRSISENDLNKIPEAKIIIESSVNYVKYYYEKTGYIFIDDAKKCDKNFLSCYFLLLDENNSVQAFSPVESFSEFDEKNYDHDSKLVSTFLHFSNKNISSSINSSSTPLSQIVNKQNNSQNENVIKKYKKNKTKKEVKLLEEIKQLEIPINVNKEIVDTLTHDDLPNEINNEKFDASEINTNKSESWTNKNLRCLGITATSEEEILKKLIELYDSLKSTSYYIIRNEWLNVYLNFMKILLKKEYVYFSCLNDIDLLKNNKFDKIFFPFKSLAEIVYKYFKEKQMNKILEAFSNLQSNLISYVNHLEKHVSDFNHTESYLAVKLLDLPSQTFEYNEINQSSIEDYAKKNLDKLVESVDKEKRNNLKLVMLIESKNECCSKCKATIYMINKVYKKVTDYPLFTVFRFKKEKQNDIVAKTSDNEDYTIKSIANRLNKLVKKEDSFLNKQDFMSIQIKTDKVYISKQHCFISGGRLVEFTELNN